MHRQNGIIRKLAVLAVTGSLLLSLTTLATAESDAVRATYLSAANVPTNIATIHTYPEAPRSFNPLTASDVELATYGFPQRPDKQADPNHYAIWERAMQAAKIRWNGELKPAHNGGRATLPAGAPPSPQAQDAQQPLAATQRFNMAAAGVVLNNGRATWSNSYSFNDIWSEISVPVVQLPFDNTTGCTDNYYHSWSLVGIDGYVVFSPVTGYPLFEPGESTGVEQAVYCWTGQTYYQAVFGWDSAFNAAFSLNPGDIFYTEIHAFGGCNAGSAFIEDLTTLTYNSYTIANPCLPAQTGRYANWIVWRPPFSNGGNVDGESPLANTIGISFEGAEVLNGIGTRFYPGSQATSTSVLTMHDDNNTQAIELVNQGSGGFQGQHSLFFQTTGCAYAGGCTK
jgi:hypothetical protein